LALTNERCSKDFCAVETVDDEVVAASRTSLVPSQDMRSSIWLLSIYSSLDGVKCLYPHLTYKPAHQVSTLVQLK